MVGLGCRMVKKCAVMKGIVLMTFTKAWLKDRRPGKDSLIYAHIMFIPGGDRPGLPYSQSPAIGLAGLDQSDSIIPNVSV